MAGAAAPAIPADSPRSLRDAARVFVGHASPRLLLAAVVACAGLRVGLGGFTAWDLAPPLLVVAFWPLQEWLIHVFILHLRPRRLGGFTVDFAVPREHRRHHADPWNYRILFIPVHSFLYSLPILAALWFGLAPTPRLALTGVTFHLLMTLHYEAVHFLIHTQVRPRTGFYRRRWRNHRLHHFRNPHYWFGVSMLGADRWLGTAPRPEDVSASAPP